MRRNGTKEDEVLEVALGSGSQNYGSHIPHEGSWPHFQDSLNSLHSPDVLLLLCQEGGCEGRAGLRGLLISMTSSGEEDRAAGECYNSLTGAKQKSLCAHGLDEAI